MAAEKKRGFGRAKYILLLLLLSVGAIVVYFLFNKKEAVKFVLPEITKVTLVKTEIMKDTAYIQIFAIAKNNSPYTINIDSILCDVSLGGKLLISEHIRYDLRQEANHSDTIDILLKIPVKDTRNRIKSLQSQEHTSLSFDATVVYNTVVGVRRLHVTKDNRIEVPTPPEISIRTERKKMQLLKKDLDVDLFLKLINSGDKLNLNISGLQYELTLGKDLYAKGKYPKDVSVKPESEQVLKFPLDFKMNTPLSTILKVWTDNDSVPFKIMLSGYLDAPNIHRLPVVIIAKGKMELVNEDKIKSDKKLKRQEGK